MNMSVACQAELSEDYLVQKAREISRNLRHRRLELEKTFCQMDSLPDKPDLYYDNSPWGQHAIVAFRTVPCRMYLKGYCTPCGYSGRAYPNSVDPSTLRDGLLRQIAWLLSHLDELFGCRRNEPHRARNAQTCADQPLFMLELAGTSSFFCDHELPPEIRQVLLERLVAFQQEREINIHLVLEMRPEHLVSAERSGELEKLHHLLRALNAAVNLGYEASDSFIRNVVYLKNLDDMTFQHAIAIAKKAGLDPGAFVFAGGYTLTAGETLYETKQTLDHLEKPGLFANVMVPNLQAYTLPDLLFEMGNYFLPEPYLVLDLIDMLAQYRPQRRNKITPFDWFLGGITADPPPRFNIFTNPCKRTSDAVSAAIHNSAYKLIDTGDWAAYLRIARSLRSAPDYQHHVEDLSFNDERPWTQRMNDALEFALQHLEEYDMRMKKQIIGPTTKEADYHVLSACA